jgi:hypothetical protein
MSLNILVIRRCCHCIDATRQKKALVPDYADQDGHARMVISTMLFKSPPQAPLAACTDIPCMTVEMKRAS